MVCRNLSFLRRDICIIIARFRIYDMDNDGYISNGELFQVLKMMVGSNLKDTQLQQIVDKTDDVDLYRIFGTNSPTA